MSRAKEFDTNTVLDAAIETFRRGGYEATSIQDLVDEMGIQRASLYETFGDKHSLFLAALDRYDDRKYAEASALLMESPGSRLEAIRRFLLGIVDQAVSAEGIAIDPFGCLMMNSLVERAAIDPACASRARRNWTRSEALYHNALVAARDEGEIGASDPELRSLARFLVSTAKGLRVSAKSYNDRATLEDIVSVAMCAVTGYRGCGGEK